MKESRIQELLARYYDGCATLAEEEELKAFFRTADIPPALQSEQEMFRQLADTTDSEPEVPAGLEERIARQIDALEAKEQQERRKPRKALLRPLVRLAGVAAVAGLLIAVGMQLQPYTPASTLQDTCATPQEAYAEVRGALLKLSATLHKGSDQLAKVQKTGQRIQENLKHSFQQLKTNEQ
ncbi:MAG: anti-sigma factor [Bacteroides sp.]|nr:anti-sigma factor [Bacteroides sp.]